jgi:hypothetical protein
MRVSDSLISLGLRGELTGSRRESSATAGDPADSPRADQNVDRANGSPVRRVV